MIDIITSSNKSNPSKTWRKGRNKMAKSKIVAVNEKIAEKVVGGYKKIETATVGGYKKIENAAVGGYKKIEDGFVDRYLTKEDESIEDAKIRLKQEQAEREEARRKAGLN